MHSALALFIELETMIVPLVRKSWQNKNPWALAAYRLPQMVYVLLFTDDEHAFDYSNNFVFKVSVRGVGKFDSVG